MPQADPDPIDFSPLARARIALDGLSVGDAFGDCFVGFSHFLEEKIAAHHLPGPPWRYTDDTAMALSIFEVLAEKSHIDQDLLAERFADAYHRDPDRGYGGTVRGVLMRIYEGTGWTTAAGDVFSGMGSMGNGAAMRVAPVGAFFADDIPRVVREARASAEITHVHPEGIAGAIAVAVAAACAWQFRGRPADEAGTALFDRVLEQTPSGETRAGIARARDLSRELSVPTAVHQLGNGSKILSQDTVPFVLWCAARHWNEYVPAMWATVSGLGDRDTTCAMVGAIVALSGPGGAPPEEWRTARESLNLPRS